MPDAGHSRLIELCQSDPDITDVPLTSEEEGVGLVAGAALGGQRAALLMQSSGVGNCINMLSLVEECRFPLLMIVPAFAIDVLHGRARRSDWTRALTIGVAYVTLMVAVHWHFSEFLISPAARNFFFGVDQWDYNLQVGPWRYEYWGYELGPTGQWSPLRFFGGCAIAMGIATLSSRVG